MLTMDRLFTLVKFLVNRLVTGAARTEPGSPFPIGRTICASKIEHRPVHLNDGGTCHT